MPKFTHHASNEILVVDDTPSNLDFITSLLRDAGYCVRAATAPALALNSALSHPPDLVILDVRMPDINGFELCQQLKSHPQTTSIPVIFVSGLTDVSDRIKGFAAGGVDFIVKPFQKDEVLARVSTHLSLRNVTRDLSLQKQRLEELVQERTWELIEERDTAQLYLDVAGVMLIALDLNGCIEMVNKRGAKILGEAENSLIGKHWIESFVLPSERESFSHLISQGIAGDQSENHPHDVRIVGKGMNEFIMSWTNSPVRDKAGKIVGLLASAEDVTDRRIIEQALQASEEKYRSFIENAPDAIFKVDELLTCKYVNPAACWLVGFSQSELHSMKFVDLLSPLDAENYRRLTLGVDRHAGFTAEFNLCRKGGKVVQTAIKAVLLPDEQIMIFCSDISELRSAEKVAIERAVELKSTLDQLNKLSDHLHDSIEHERMTMASDIHDQIGASLTGARMMIGKLELESSDLPDKARETLKQVRELVTLALESSRGVYTRLRPPMLDDIGLVETCRWYLHDWADKSGIEIEQRISSIGDEPNEALRMDLFRIFQELLTNVSRHSNARKVVVSLTRSANEIVLYVKDDGIGFDASAIQGGFGLQGIRSRVSRHNGSFSTKREKQGSRVTIQFPTPSKHYKHETAISSLTRDQ